MRLTVALLGWSLDLSLEPTTTEDEAPTNQGDTGGTWVGFAVHATPEDVPLPQRTPAWDEPE